MYLLDTNILSELIKKHPNKVFIERLRKIPGNLLFTSSICVMELRYGSARRPDHKEFWQRIKKEILSRVNILVFASTQAVKTGDILVYLYQKGKPIGLEDIMIAATALCTNCTVITANVRHFKEIPGLKVENWLT